MDAGQGAAAAAGVGGDVADVAGAEADHRAGLLAQRGVDELAARAGLEHLARRGVHGLHEDLVLHDVQAVLGLAHGRAGTVDVGQAEEVHELGAPQILDGLARGCDGAAGLTCDDDGVDVEVGLGVESLLDGLVAQLPGVGRARPDDGGLVVLQHEEQAVGGHGAHPDGRGAQVLRTDDVGSAHVEGEVEAVDVAVGGTHSGLPEQACLGVLPQVEVLLGERAHRGHAGRARACGHEHDVLLGHGAQPAEEGADALGLALGLLVDEGELLDVLERVDVLGAHAGLVPGLLVVGGVVVGPAHHLLQALELELLELGAGQALDLGVVVLLVVGQLLLCHCGLAFVCLAACVCAGRRGRSQGGYAV